MTLAESMQELLEFRKQTEVLDAASEKALDDAIKSISTGECVNCERLMYHHRVGDRYVECPEWPEVEIDVFDPNPGDDKTTHPQDETDQLAEAMFYD